MTRISLHLMFIILVNSALSAQEQASSTIDDGDKGSTKYGNLVDKLETAEKAYDAVNAISTGTDAAKRLKSFDPQKVDISKLSKKIKEEALAWATKYTSAKGGFNTFTKNILQKVDKVATKVSDRVDLWRTTWPTMKRYARSITHLADNSKQLFSDFKVSDLWDINRKWDRRLDANIHAYRNTFRHIRMFMNSFTSDERKEFYYSNIVPTENNDRFSADPLCVIAKNRMIDLHPYRDVPYRTLEFCSSTMFSLSEIDSMISSPDISTSTISKEDAVLKQIEDELTNPDQTYADSRELSSLIEEQRAKIGLEMIQITQLQSAVELRYANLVKRDKEATDQQEDFYKKSLKILCAGKSRYYQTENN
jgi:hypothetical protein